MTLSRRCVPATLLAVAWSVAAPVAARAHEPETLDFARPESWGMKYYASLALLSGMGAPHALRAGELELGLEGGYVPQLSDAERRIGFHGTKLEDVNKTSFFGRVRGSVGVGGARAASSDPRGTRLAGDESVLEESMALSRPLNLSNSWRLGVRGYGQIGTIEADVTCSADEVAAGDDVSANPFQCVEPSRDESRQKLIGLELAIGYDARSRFKPYVGLGATYMDLEFHIDALYSDGLVEDHGVLLTSGTAISATAGLSYAAGERWRVTAEVFYSWLKVARPPSITSANEGFLNSRLFVSYRVN